MNPTAELAWRTAAELGEGALWDPVRQRLLWVDIAQKRVGLFDPASGTNQTVQLDSKVGTVVPTTRGDLLVALQEGVARLDPETGKVSDLVCPPDHDATRIRFNDGKCDPRGRFWAGTMALNHAPGEAALYCFEPGGRIHRRLTGVSISNGLAWSRDERTMYYIDTLTRAVDAFDYDVETGAISRRRRACSIPDELGYPDGMTMDEEGKLWIALWGGNAVTRWDPDSGELLARIAVPAAQVTSCAFGGPGLKSLFITSAREELSAEELERQPLSGSLFVATPGVAGLPAMAYRG